eukprot:7359155-Prymnesium_polylepis.1
MTSEKPKTKDADPKQKRPSKQRDGESERKLATRTTARDVRAGPGCCTNPSVGGDGGQGTQQWTQQELLVGHALVRVDQMGEVCNTLEAEMRATFDEVQRRVDEAVQATQQTAQALEANMQARTQRLEQRVEASLRARVEQLVAQKPEPAADGSPRAGAAVDGDHARFPGSLQNAKQADYACAE